MSNQQKYNKDNINGIKFQVENTGLIYTCNKLNDISVLISWVSFKEIADINYTMGMALHYLNCGVWTEVEK